MRLSFLLLLALASAGCDVRPSNSQGETCRDASDCTVEAGQLAACIRNACEAVECLSSADCALGSWCPAADGDFSCKPGCETNDDCHAGESCSAEGTCEAYGCRNTNLDCWIGEVCNQATGECEESPEPHCAVCNGVGEWEFEDQGTLDPCDDEWTGHGGCGGDGAQCGPFTDGGDQYCMVPCGADDSCPRGYTCQDVPISFNTQLTCGFMIEGSSRVCVSGFGCEDLY
jgi:hypothetical protein